MRRVNLNKISNCECLTWCRPDHPIGLPFSKHHSNCPNYKLKTFFSVKFKDESGGGCVFKTKPEAQIMVDETPEEEYVIVPIQMTEDQFEQLDEFDGF